MLGYRWDENEQDLSDIWTEFREELGCANEGEDESTTEEGEEETDNDSSGILKGDQEGEASFA